MPDLDRKGLSQQQLSLIAQYELHQNLVCQLGATAEMNLDAWMAQRTTEDCAFLLRYFSTKASVIHRTREAMPHEHARRPH